ncbi:VWA domain-containing protein [Beggiatoa leptomitoformis]|uniref:VWA domain-containing protein n=1 Tax=Beggiatoa leptomitoformis TaxID=288004 RepID=A0A2N9YFM2_9GAMM|nr:VWA domain-containing protein [Beggiatoa leptomitoformis]ALG68384.1 VWA domain-containing protein [Beggiatoa leptomitoformis]AUI69292.1 VWA domain-containing protein [Beggiatoa leptomitoformis]
MTDNAERLRRWRLLLGGGGADGTGCQLNKNDMRIDNALSQLYDNDQSRKGGLGSSAPNVARWLGDIREYFPQSVVRVMQKDAIDRLNLSAMLLQPEILETLEADVHLVANIMSLNHSMPEKTKETARIVVNKVVNQLLEKLELTMQQAVRGSLNRAMRNNRPRHSEIDWLRTIRANLKNYQPDYQSIIPERLIGYARKQRRTLQDIILCVDQSGSMASSVVYASIFAAVMASIPAVKTQMIVFDTVVMDLTDMLVDPVEVLFGTQLGGGTDINNALAYCEKLVSKPEDTTLVLITDLYEGGDEKALVRRAANLVQAGVQVITLLALNDDGSPIYSAHLAQAFAGLGIPTFACTPDQFPDLMAMALRRQDISQWAAANNIVLASSIN